MVLSTALVTLLGMPTVSMATDTGSASTTNTTIDPEFDVSTGWTITKYTSDLTATIPKIDEIFIQGTVGETGMKTASAHGTNLGNATFETQRVIHLKGGKKYTINLYYGLSYKPYKPASPRKKDTVEPSASIDFNGTTFTLTANSGNFIPYNETVEPTADMDYIITMAFTVPRGAEMYTMVGMDTNDPNSGIHEVVDPEPVPEESASTEPSETTTTDDSSTTSTTTSEDPATSSTAAEDNHATSSSNDPTANGNGAAGTSSSSSSSNYKDPADPADPAKKANLPRTNETNSATISMIGFGCLAVLAATTYWLKKVKKTGNN